MQYLHFCVLSVHFLDVEVVQKGYDIMITVNMAATGANIKNMMKARNIKVKDVQAVCGFGTPQAIFKWMRGDCMPTIDNMLIIADMFGCTMDDIVVVNKQGSA